MEQPFIPALGQTVSISVSASSQSVAVSVPPNGGGQVRVANDGTATVWINFGKTGVTASTTTSYPLPAGAVEVVTVPVVGGPVYAAVIAAGSTGSVYFTPGDGF